MIQSVEEQSYPSTEYILISDKAISPQTLRNHTTRDAVQISLKGRNWTQVWRKVLGVLPGESISPI